MSESFNEEFDWRRDRDCVVVPEQLQIAVYENGLGNLVIRQQDPMGDDDDWVVVDKSNVPALCRALMEAAGIEIPQPAVTLFPPAKTTGAERSRRYRQRHAQRDDVTDRDGGVTQRDGLSDELPLGVAAE